MKIIPYVRFERVKGEPGHEVGIRVTLTFREIGAWFRRRRQKPHHSPTADRED